ncbi:MAG: signal peptide peptidase SppA [Fidelibacterota bacterium]
MDQTGLKRPSVHSNRRIWWILGGVLVIIFIFRLGMAMAGLDESGGIGDKVGIVTINGPIYSAENLVRDLDRLQERDDVKAIVLRIESPGGLVAPTQEIYEKVKVLKNIKPVVVSLGAVAASGGYYIAVAGDSIVANRGSILGSIGVIMNYPIAEKLLDKIGISVETVKSGALKDTGSPTRKVTSADKEYLQTVVSDLYEQFVRAVADGRSLPVEAVRSLADGRVFTGEQSLTKGLVDRLGTMEDAVQLAGSLAQISGKPKILRLHKSKPSILEWFREEWKQSIGTRFDELPAYRWRME